MDYINNLKPAFLKHASSQAFCINTVFYSYQDLAIAVSSIRTAIVKHITAETKLVGLVTNDDLETYAGIIALWLEGKAYVPINPEIPFERNLHILESIEAHHIIDSSKTTLYTNFNVIASKTLEASSKIHLSPVPGITEDDLAYILFTSGSTGTPKGVTISHKNVNGFVKAIDSDPDFNLQPTDRCLQMFELTFDMSVVSYLLPLLSGACIYTVPSKSIKYFHIFKLMQQYKLTVLTMVASIINYLRPYFNEIHAPEVRYCSFAGGALYEAIAAEWSDCLPNCKIYNYYGPTETTIYSGFYPYNKHTHTKSHNGIISIGTPMGDLKYMVVDAQNQTLPLYETGELCIAGSQVTPGYWKKADLNENAFLP